MIKTTSNKVKALSRVLALGAAVIVTAASTRAHASASINTVAVVEVNQASVTVPYNLLVQLTGGVNYVAFLANPPTGCAVTTIDNIKAWQSLTQSALLAGKNVQIYFTACSGYNNIATIDLLK
jgi:hypothetical protein